MQAMGILFCKRHWEFNVAAQPAAMHLADVWDPQPHPSTFDLMFHSFLPSLNNHLTMAEAQCSSADGSKPLSELQGQELHISICRQQKGTPTHSLLHPCHCHPRPTEGYSAWTWLFHCSRQLMLKTGWLGAGDWVWTSTPSCLHFPPVRPARPVLLSLQLPTRGPLHRKRLCKPFLKGL